MRADTQPTATTVDLDPIGIDQNEAARLTGLSAKTLERLAVAGEPVGRLKIGRRVVFHVETLNAWMKARLVNSANQ